uniref:Speckle-type POZ protein-like (inferred by orthology to a human protein) n=1 Tax=Strongyloides venezuelensis TaxID=75913 RepID=A0A0K0FQ12_STRVS
MALANNIPYNVLYTNQTDVIKFKYKYTIQNFSQRSENIGEKIISPTFVVGSKEKSEWCLHIYPNGDNEESKEYVSVYLELLKPNTAITKYRFSILNEKGEEKNIFNCEDFGRFDNIVESFSWGFPKFVKKNFLLDRSNGLLINDKLTILCEAEIIELKSENHENSIPYDVFYTNQTDVIKFKYKYIIENFSLRPEKTGEYLISPTFKIGSKELSEWCLHIYPNGDEEESKDYVSVYLELLKPNAAIIKYRFSILNEKGEEKNILDCADTGEFNYIVESYSWRLTKFVKKNFLLDRSNGLLINDKLTILCVVEIIELKSENHENSIPYDVFYTNQRDVNNFKYKYTIENFSLRPEKIGKKIILPAFVVGSKERSEWRLHIYPNGENGNSKEYVSVFLILLKPDKAKIKFRFSILNDKKEKKNVKFVTEWENIIKDRGLGFSQFVKRDFLLNESNGLLTNNKLTIQCEAEITDLKSENHGNLEIVESNTENRSNPETSMNISKPHSKLSLDYGNLYDSSLLYDCIIKAEDREIKAHKAILAARSPAFHEIFTKTSDNSQTNIIEIKDFNVEVVEKMLIYIYTDKVSDIQNMANQIFEIANIYKLDRLKSISEQAMCESLTADNVLKRFALSDKYPTERLKECCEELILKNMNHLKETKEWEDLIIVRPSLLQGLLFKSTNISSKEKNSEKKDKN